MNRATEFTADGDYTFKELGYGRDTTVWFDVFEFEDGTKLSVSRHDPRRDQWFAEIENYNEALASDIADNGRDFSGHYEP